jgi:hypothetical protein
MRYFLRWQLSTLVLLLLLTFMPGSLWLKVVVANMGAFLVYAIARAGRRKQSHSVSRSLRHGQEFIPYRMHVSLMNKLKFFKFNKK